MKWVKATRSNSSGNCAEFARAGASGDVWMRNSRFPEGPVLIFTRAEIAAMLDGAKAGEFDHLLAD